MGSGLVFISLVWFFLTGKIQESKKILGRKSDLPLIGSAYNKTKKLSKTNKNKNNKAILNLTIIREIPIKQ